MFVLALAARLHGIGDKPFWLDELTTLRRAALPFWAMVHDSLMYHHLPGYFAVVSTVLPWGHDEAVVRAPSALFGALTCSLIGTVGWRIGGRSAGLLAGLLAAFSPIAVQYGQEARSYTLVTLGIATSLLGLVRLVGDPRRAGAGFANGGDPGGWARLLGGTWLAVNTLSIALAWPIAATLGWAIAIRRAADRRALWRAWLLGHAVIAALTAPWFAAIYGLNHGWMADGLTWIPPLDLDRFRAALGAVYLMRVGSLIDTQLVASPVPVLAAIMLAAAGAGALWLRRHRAPALGVLAAALLVLPGALLAVSAAFPLWLPRYLLWSTLPWCVLGGLGVNVLPRRLRPLAVLGVGVIAAINLGSYYDAETKPRWDQAAHALRDMLDDDDIVVVEDERLPELLTYFLAREGVADRPERWASAAGSARARLVAGRRVWLARGAVGQTLFGNPLVLPSGWEGLGKPAVILRFGRHVGLIRLDPT